MSYTYKDNTDEVLSALKKAKRNGLTAIGFEAEGHAKKVITQAGAVDTGRLRNSITFAVSGQQANIKAYTGDHGEEGGSYEGQTPSDKNMAVYVGTNVSYAHGIELGSHRKKGAVHFLLKAATEPKQRYKQLFEDAMKSAK
jgi:hypothetical protein